MKSILKCLYQYSRNKDIKESILKAFNKDFYIRRNVASYRKNNLISILEYLSNDKEPEVRASVARNSKTPVSVLEYLSKDKISSYVRYWVAKNPRTPIYILEKLSNDEYENVRENADNNLNEKIKSNIK